MNPRFVVCLIASGLAGLCVAVTLVAAGWGLIVGLLTYSVLASGLMLMTTWLVRPGEPAGPALPADRARRRGKGALA